MSLRPLLPLLCISLLVACADKPVAPPDPAPEPQPVSGAPRPSNLNELSGTLRTPEGAIAPGAKVEIAMLAIDGQDRPQRLLASETLTGNGKALAFRLPFNPEIFPRDARVELHARVSQGGMLVCYLTPVTIRQPMTQVLGELVLDQKP
ncbi:putative lipoprotein YbaY [Pseudomonas duriflava]|uniref:Putative lipoprotein YbaY n=1 Tax=Pseudomonas duriflava TaxID=459528 RepID=A0A562Q6U5_9PSED|nr:YbaY family lipoprotein [Pseudomonas duriflava]TWI52434.1 putative lipoprotein YbaY [Pseudomonas duriflava]